MNLESRLYDAIRYIGVLAPVPTAYVICISLNKHLHWHIIIAFIAAVIIEVVGFGVVYMWAIFREYNQSKRKTDPAAPLSAVSWMVGLYLVSVLLLTVVLDIFPALSLYAPGLFPFLSVIGMALTALRYDHMKRLQTLAIAMHGEETAKHEADKQDAIRIALEQREETERQEKEARRIARQVAKETKAQQQAIIEVAPVAEPLAPELTGNRLEVYKLLRDNPKVTQATIAATVGITRQAVGKHITQLTAAGILNGTPAAVRPAGDG